jgi:hypothetical protein
MVGDTLSIRNMVSLPYEIVRRMEVPSSTTSSKMQNKYPTTFNIHKPHRPKKKEAKFGTLTLRF